MLKMYKFILVKLVVHKKSYPDLDPTQPNPTGTGFGSYMIRELMMNWFGLYPIHSGTDLYPKNPQVLTQKP